MKSPTFIQKVSVLKSNRRLFFTGLTILLCSLTLISFQNKVTEEKGEVKIQQVSNNEPEILTKGHKHHDVQVFKIVLSPPYSTYGRQIYSVQYYFNLKDSLTGRKAWFPREDDFDKTSYKWLNDSTVAITLFNSVTTAKSDTFKLFGFDRGSGIITNE